MVIKINGKKINVALYKYIQIESGNVNNLSDQTVLSLFRGSTYL